MKTDRPINRDALRYHRIRAHLSQQTLANLSDLATGTISRWETGSVRRPHWETLERLAAVLKVDPEELLENQLPRE
jgi:transcriptional regulator with XRE-family HTH domain